MRYEQIQEGTVEDTRINVIGHRGSVAVSSLRVMAGEGVVGDSHYGHTRLSDVREVHQGSTDTALEVPVLNTRQFSMTSVEESARVAEAMDLGETQVPRGLQGENLLVAGIDNLTQLPSGTIFKFAGPDTGIKAQRKAVLLVWGENIPCSWPHDNIVAHYAAERPERTDWMPAQSYNKAAMGRRGLVGMVYRSGKIKPQDIVMVFRPKAQE